MMRLILIILLPIINFGLLKAQTADRKDGPIIDGYGSVWDIENPDFQIDPKDEFKLVFDIYLKPEDPRKLNLSINTIARFLNMHARAGVKSDQISLVAVVHGGAGNDVMNDSFYRQKYGVDNPNRILIEKLEEAGVKFYLCGQTMNSRGLERAQLLPEVGLALSAMTAITQMVNAGYALMKM